MTPREEWDARIKATLDRSDEVIARSDAVIDRGIDDEGNYVPIEDDPTEDRPTVPTWRELEAAFVVTRPEADAVAEEIRAHYQPHRRSWRWVFALIGLIVCVVLFALIAAYVINGADPAPVQNWTGEF